MPLPIEMLPRIVKVISIIQDGRTLSDACDLAGVSYTTFRNYVDKDPDLQAQYNTAIRYAEDMMADALPNIGSHPIYGTNVPAMASVISNNIKWLLSRRRPKEYGDKIEHSVHISADKEVLEALMRSKERSQGFGAVIDGTVVSATTRLLVPPSLPDHGQEATDLLPDEDYDITSLL